MGKIYLRKDEDGKQNKICHNKYGVKCYFKSQQGTKFKNKNRCSDMDLCIPERITYTQITEEEYNQRIKL